MTTPKHIARLATKQLLGTITPKEEQALQRWADAESRYREWLDGLADKTLQDTAEVYGKYQPIEAVWDNPKLWQHIQQSLPRRRPLYRRHGFQWMAAAVAILVLAFGVWFSRNMHQGSANNLVVQEILPGGNRATLMLADGRTIDLSEEQAGIVIGEEITYQDGSGVAEVGDNPSAMLTTPKGGTYQITLPDGTQVWLNAASTLKYPSRFTQDERRVEITGEAYFAVAKDAKRPFKVVSRGQEIEVLGTKFNVSAYADDAEIKTTLVEGKVRLTATADPQSPIILRPRQQSILSGSQLDLKAVDTAPYTAWKDGYFAFDDASIRVVMQQLARWYDMEIVYDGEPSRATFDGEISRDLTLQQVLSGLSATRINYQINGKTLTIVSQP